MKILSILLLLILASCKQNNSDWIDRSKHKGLFKIEATDKFETYATVKKPENIASTIQNLEMAKAYFDSVFDEDLNFAVLFIDNENWDIYAFAPPPGMPQAYYEGNMVLGLGKSVMAQNHERGLENASETELEKLKKYYGNEIDLDLFFRDVLSVHELGHLYQSYRTGSISQSRWLNELFGNLCQIAAVKNFETSNTFDKMDSYQNYVTKTNPWGDPKYKTLEQFENDYFEIFKQGRNYGWYQAKFYAKAKVLYSIYGNDILVKFRNFQIKINKEEFGEINDSDLNDMMLKEFGTDIMKILEWNYN